MSQVALVTATLPFILCLCGITISRAALPPLPNKVKVCSTVLYSQEANSEQFKVEEFVDQHDKSIRLDVLDVTIGRKNVASHKMSYYKLMGGNKPKDGKQKSDKDEPERLVAFDDKEGRCNEVLVSEWRLKELTRLLARLSVSEFKLAKEEGEQARRDSISIGPFGLFKLVYDSADLFRLDSKSSDEVNMNENYHFSIELGNFYGTPKRNGARLIATMSLDKASLTSVAGSSLKIGESLLSEVLNAPSDLSSIAIVVYRSGKSPTVNELSSLAALEEIIHNKKVALVEGLVVAYNLFNEYLVSNHLEYDEVADDMQDPFLVPAASGCGAMVDNNWPYYIEASQFSGEFEAKDYKGHYYVAYDGPSNHLRYDLLGNYKMIYALQSKLVTYVAADSSKPATQTTKGKQQQVSKKTAKTVGRTHCAQAELLGERVFWWTNKTWFPWANANNIGHILGLGPSQELGLWYLGRANLASSYGRESSDPLACHVFEREITLADLPILIYMHIRVVPTINVRLFLVYHFVDESGTLSRANLHDEPSRSSSLWLKRVDLISLNKSSRYSYISAQITFNKFSWSLETVGEDTRNRQLQLAHPVRTFDLAECTPDTAQYQLDLVLKRQADSSGLQLGGGGSLEDTLIGELTRGNYFVRSQISDFSLQAFPPGLGDTNTEATSASPPSSSSSSSSLLLQSKLTFALNYYYSTELIGWVQSVEPLLKREQVQLERRLFVIVRECTLKLATEQPDEYMFHMVFCPNAGCGRLLVSIDQLHTETKPSPFIEGQDNLILLTGAEKPDSGPSLSVHNDMCELLQVHKKTYVKNTAGKAERVKMFQKELTKPNKLIGPYQVVKVALQAGLSELAAVGRDQIVILGVCYTASTRLFKDQQLVEKILGEHQVHLARINFDKHHSRIHCHKACLMYSHCETYSYNHSSRECILANIQADTLKDPSVTLESSDWINENDCAIYLVDRIASYKRTSDMVPQTPANFVAATTYRKKAGDGDGDRAVVVLADIELDKCANLCHSTDWSMQTKAGRVGGCRQFSFMHHNSLCKFTVPDRAKFVGLFGASSETDPGLTLVANPADLHQDHVDQVEALETYERDYDQYYSVMRASFIDLIQPASSAGDTIKAVHRKYSLDECTRQCTVGQCLMFDFCSEYSASRKSYTGTCYLYSIRSPLSVEQLRKIRMKPNFTSKWPKLKLQATAAGANLQLTSLEELFYLEGKSSKHEVLVKNRDACQHHYLVGDYLYIKRSLNLLNLIEADPEVERQDTRDAHHWAVLAATLALQLVVGLVIGFGMFIVKPTIAKTIEERLQRQRRASSLDEPIQSSSSAAAASLWALPFQFYSKFANKQQRRPRSASRVEIHEMMDIED